MSVIWKEFKKHYKKHAKDQESKREEEHWNESPEVFLMMGLSIPCDRANDMHLHASQLFRDPEIIEDFMKRWSLKEMLWVIELLKEFTLQFLTFQIYPKEGKTSWISDMVHTFRLDLRRFLWDNAWQNNDWQDTHGTNHSCNRREIHEWSVLAFGTRSLIHW